MSEAKGGSKGHRRSRAEVGRLIEEFEQSGLTRRAFCAAHGLSINNLNGCLRRRRGSGSGSPGAIVPVELVDGACGLDRRSALWVELNNGRRIEVGSGFDALTLERLVRALEGVR
jgi:hypothetical protein